MADMDLFHSQFTVFDDNNHDLVWSPDSLEHPDWDSLDGSLLHQPSTPDCPLGLLPDPNRRHCSTTNPAPFHPQPTVRLSDLSLPSSVPMTMQMPISNLPPFQIPLSASTSGTLSDTTDLQFYGSTDPSSEDMDSEFDPADSDFIPSPSINPASISAPSVDSHAIRPSRRGSRSMIRVPVPIPGLAKKSRGRKVPTSNGEPVYAASRDKTKKGVRTYTCQADGCGKCFVRGEHLKRHIRSIHTNEKRRSHLVLAVLAFRYSSLTLVAPKHGCANMGTAVVHLAGGTT
ncbi:hypothetical protein JVU11DRAFT_1082 [Chiua virens]|nr:hypothetical protein JVU11DRAFT_12712 [Chiua virens]KAG9318967.1 hypothetical protein JVU11DRAFT_1082 [Chiua virens]